MVIEGREKNYLGSVLKTRAWVLLALVVIFSACFQKTEEKEEKTETATKTTVTTSQETAEAADLWVARMTRALADPKLRAVVFSRPRARAEALAEINALPVSAERKEEIFRMAAVALQNLMKQHKGNRSAVGTYLSNVDRNDPTAFAVIPFIIYGEKKRQMKRGMSAVYGNSIF